MGLTTLPEVGTGEALGPVKVSRPFAAPDPLRDITVAEHNAAMTALEGVCAEVGLHDGSTAGSLVERVTALEDAPSGSGDVVGPASAADDRIATFNGTTGKLIQDGGVTVAQLATASDLSTHISNTSNPHSVTAAQINALPTVFSRQFHTTDAAITSTENNVVLQVSPSGTDIDVLLASSCVQGQTTVVTRYLSAYPTDPGGDILIGVASGTHVIQGPTRITRAGGTLILRCVTLFSGTHYWAIEGADDSPSAPIVQASEDAATRTIAVTDHDAIIPIDASSNAVEVTIPHTLFGALGLNRAFVFSGSVVNVDNAITLVGSGGLSLVYYGVKNTLDTTGDVFTVVVESATTARVYIAEAF